MTRCREVHVVEAQICNYRVQLMRDKETVNSLRWMSPHRHPRCQSKNEKQVEVSDAMRLRASSYPGADVCI